MQAKAQMAQNLIDSGNVDQIQNQWPSGNMVGVGIPSFHQANYPAAAAAAATYMNISSLSLQNSLDDQSIMDQSSTDHGVVMASRMRGIHNDRSDDDQLSFQPYNYSKKRPSQTDLSELQALALRMMRD